MHLAQSPLPSPSNAPTHSCTPRIQHVSRGIAILEYAAQVSVRADTVIAHPVSPNFDDLPISHRPPKKLDFGSSLLRLSERRSNRVINKDRLYRTCARPEFSELRFIKTVIHHITQHFA